MATLIGTNGDDIIEGTSGADTISGLGGNDSLYGLGEYDRLYGGPGNDLLDGGDGNDRFEMQGDSGVVIVGSDSILGGNGEDYVSFSSPKSSTNAIIADLQRGTWSSADGGGTLVGVEIIAGSWFDDRISGSAASEGLYGGRGNDYLDGRAGDDVLGDQEGDDTLYGGSGRDSLTGGVGDDRLYAGPGNDTLNGNDLIPGTANSDWLEGDAGDDYFQMFNPFGVFGPLGNDTVVGGSGTDRVEFSSTGPLAWSTPAVAVDLEAGTWSTSDSTGGISGVEEVVGSLLGDRIMGSDRAESLSGAYGVSADGDDFIDGRGGHDTLHGGPGIDTLTGGAGADDFLFDEVGSRNADLIEDFASGRDDLVFDNKDSVYAAIGEDGKWAAGDERFYAAADATSGHDANDRLIYDTASGDLYYDSDGSGSAAALIVATLESAPTLLASDIVVI